MNYSTLVSTLANLMPVSATNANFLAELPDTINYAENRICRDLDFLYTWTPQNSSTPMAAGSVIQIFTTASPIVVLQQVNVFVPSGSSILRYSLTRQSLPYMMMMYPLAVATGVPLTDIPTDFAIYSEASSELYVGVAPGQNYNYELIGTVRPPQISALNPNGWVCVNLPDLYVAACMVRLSGYKQNYDAAASDNPQEPINWETQYQALLKGAVVEELRKKAQGPSWSDQFPSPIATPPRM